MDKPISTQDRLLRAALLERLKQRRSGVPAAHSETVELTRVDRNGPLEASWSQQRLWFLAQLDPAASVAYHIPVGIQLTGRLDRAVLRATLDRIVARHEILRTTFAAGENGRPYQIIATGHQDFSLTQHDLRALDEAARQAQLDALTHEEARTPFDLARGPLIRGRLLQLADDRHVLLLTQHHIISDGWSLNVLIQEVSALYSALRQGLPDPLPDLAIQYVDYTAWQHRWLDGPMRASQLDFWREHLRDAPTLLELPADRPRAPVQSYRGRSVHLTLPAPLANGLRALAQRHGATLFMALLAGWSVLLSRLSGQPDVVIGTPVANRQRAEFESLMGFFVNTLALRVSVADDPSVAGLMARVRRFMLDAYAHQDVPFEQVVEAVQPARSLGHNPLFQAMLALNNTTAHSLNLPDLALSAYDVPRTTTQCDLTLSLTETADGITGQLEYSSDLFDATTIERLAAQFQVLLQAMTDDETQHVSRLPLLGAAERERILVSFNRTERAFPQEALIHQLFEQQARLQPDAIAVIHETHALRYGELNERANRIAHHLIGLGLRPDDRVAICVERSIDMVAGLLGILKAGACYVPLDPSYPAERLAHMLRDSAPAALLTQCALRNALPAHDAPLLLLDDPDTAALLHASPAHDPDPRVLGLSSRNLAYVIYTSGSTGMPKGVMVEHRSVLNLWQALEKALFDEIPGVARVGQNAALSFDASVQTFLQLLSGRTMVLFPQTIRLDSAAFLDYLSRNEVEVFDCTPSQLAFLIRDGVIGAGAFNPKAVLVGGEAIDSELWQRLSALTSTRVYNLYGPTECTVDATLDRVQALGERPSIGRPLANTQVYILDAQGQPVPVGVSGEIHIGGVGLARGYLGQPELTAQRFIADPFSSDPHARLYKSGDLGRWLPDGTIEYLGRNDFQVKLRGFRIELGEIESRLRACPGVRDALVIAREDQPGDKRLVAYLLAHQDAELAAAGLRDQLAAGLPDYMVPSAFVTLDTFPLTPNGKLDRRALPAPDLDSVVTREYAAPQGEIELAVAQIWQTLLGLERVGRHDDFFELGGHSLLAVQLASRLRQELGVEIALRELFAQPTLGRFSSTVAERLRSALSRPNLVAIRSHGDKPPIFFVHAIEGEVGYVRELATHLDQSQPVYALAATGLLEGEAPLTSIPAMAARYLAAIRDVQLHGPYRLAGWSAGGTIAYEMAQQLIGADEGVAFLGLIDTRSDYSADRAPKPRTERPGATQAEMLTDLVSSVIDSQAFTAVPQAGDADLDARLLRCQATGAIPADIDIAILRRHLALRHSTKSALLEYLPQPMSIDMHLFTADDEDRSEPRLGWAALQGIRLRHIPVGGTHHSMVTKPHAKRLAETIEQSLPVAPDAGKDAPELRYSPRITIQAGRRTATPLFFVPGAGASVTAFFELARTLDLDIPIHGMQPRGLDGVLVPHVDVQSAASAYIKVVRDVAPEGRYHLIGHSYGGWIALEMAQRLEQMGAPVDALVLLDSHVPGTHNRWGNGYFPVDTLMYLIRHFEMNAGRSLDLYRQDLEVLSDEARLELLLAKLVDAKVLPRQTRIHSLRGVVRLFRSNIGSHYDPSFSYKGEVHLVTATPDETDSRQQEPEWEMAARWRRYAPQLDVWQSTGNHMTMLNPPHVAHLADRLRPLLRGQSVPSRILNHSTTNTAF
ncbi:amino acid adenylation domain-containing protein [Paraburkholderia metrosideri]|uniref:Amino acid adenylation domain-containing protein n=1 Tax=Paraburkholderia metrosideri TaxID=580937 RepID=A0ABW9DV90_9BURK